MANTLSRPFEAQRGQRQHALRASAILNALLRLMPPAARDDLTAEDDATDAHATATAWAARWHVSIPAVIDFMAAWLALWRQADSDRRCRLLRTLPYSRVSDDSLPAEWLATLARLNGHPLTAFGFVERTGVVDRLASEADPLAATVLGESRSEFMARAGRHYDARAALAREQGYAPMDGGTLSNLDDHAEWLVRYQVAGESFARIAANVLRDRWAVGEAVNLLANAVSLPLRSASRGGRPRGPKTRRV